MNQTATSIDQAGILEGTQSNAINAQIAKDTGVAINGNVNTSTINSNQNTLTTGTNTNLNLVAPTTVNPTQANSSGGVGGSAVLMLPRNPLPMPNALLGRSNFGVQFGLQNNPILGGLGGLNGKQSALGWFLQAGLSIPFGKIPDAYRNQRMSQLDDVRRQNLDQRRNIFGQLSPDEGDYDASRKVKARITGMGAYNYATIPSSKISLPEGIHNAGGGVKIAPPKLLALSPSDVYSRPLNVGNKVGVIEVGNEYPYLGHTKSGWVKIILPNGTEGWTSTHFEYIKNDFTEIDGLAIVPMLEPKHVSITPPRNMNSRAKTTTHGVSNVQHETKMANAMKAITPGRSQRRIQVD